MSLKPQRGVSNYKPIPAGSHPAYLFSLVDLGTQEEDGQWGLKQQPKIRVGFEVPGETIEIDGKTLPMTHYQEYTNSLGRKANWRHHLEGWRGSPMTQAEIEAFDPTRLLGKKCMLTVIHKTSAAGNLRAEINGISQLPKGMTAMPPMHNRPFVYDIADGENEVFNAFPDFIKEKIAKCLEWNQQPPAAAAGQPSAHRPGQDDPPPEQDDSDSIPF